MKIRKGEGVWPLLMVLLGVIVFFIMMRVFNGSKEIINSIFG